MAEFQLYMFLRMFVDQTVHAILPKRSWNILKLWENTLLGIEVRKVCIYILLYSHSQAHYPTVR